MPRSSRHKSHKQHKHTLKDLKEGSESEEEGMSSKQQRTETVMELPRKVREVSQVVRVSKDLESNDAGKSKLQSVSQQGRDLFAPGNDDFSTQYFTSKRRKERIDSVVTDRWNGGDDEHGQGLIGDVSDSHENESKAEGREEKGPKVKVSVDSKSKSSRRHENLGEVGPERVLKVKEEVPGVAAENEHPKRSSGKAEQRQKSEKESSRKEVYQYKDGKEKERGGVERDKKADVKREKSVDIAAGMTVSISDVSRKQTAQEGPILKQEVENTEWQIQENLRNPELEKELEKRIRRRTDGSGDARDGDDRCLSSRDDRIKNGRYKDERHKDSRYKDKYRGDLDRDHRYRDDKPREERSSRDRANDRSDNKHLRDDYRSSESRHKKTKLLDSDRDVSPHVDGRNSRSKDSRGRKRSSDDNGDRGDLKSRNSKELRADVAMNALSGSKADSVLHKGRSESPDLHMDIVDDAIGNNQQKSSPGWYSSKQAESAYRSPLSEEKVQQPTGSRNSREQASGFEVPEKVTESQPLEKPKHKQDHLDELSTANAAASQYEKSPRSVGQTSPAQLTEKSPSPATLDHRNSSKITRMQSLDAEEINQRSSSSKDAREINPNEDRERISHLEKRMGDEFSQSEMQNTDLVPISSSSFDRTGLFSGSSSSLLPPPPPFRLGIDTPSVLGSEDDLRVQTGDRKFNNRYKRTGDLMGRGQGNSWKGIPNWPLPVTNGFLPFQPGPAAAGFHAVMPQFSAPPLFGVRPGMELTSGTIPYHMHEGDRFSGHGHPFGWRGPADDPSQPHVQSHLHGWEGSGGTFGDESHIYGRSDWDQNRHLMGSRGWDMNPDLWKGQNGGMNMEFPASQKEPDYPPRVHPDEAWVGQPGHRSRHERNRLERFPTEGIEIKRSEDAPLAKTEVEAQRNVHQKELGRAKISNATNACFYLSKLDISMDLAGPELYQQCTSLLGLKDGTAVASRESPGRISLESWPENTKVLAGSSNHGLRASSFFPKVTAVIFERAMTFYEQQKRAMEVMIHAAKKPKKASPALEAEKATLQTIGSPSDGEKRSGNSSCDSSDGAMGQSDIVPCPIILADGSDDDCEALKPESIGFRVNLNRIRSPESTH